VITGNSLILKTAGTTETQRDDTSMLYLFFGQKSKWQKTPRKLQLLWKKCTIVIITRFSYGTAQPKLIGALTVTEVV